jgi:hypothetical protein
MKFIIAGKFDKILRQVWSTYHIIYHRYNLQNLGEIFLSQSYVQLSLEDKRGNVSFIRHKHVDFFHAST